MPIFHLPGPRAAELARLAGRLKTAGDLQRRALYDRPLIWLLPFYMFGVAQGWAGAGREPDSVFIWAAAAAVLSWPLFSAWRPALGRPLLIPVVFLLGWGLTLRALQPPSGPDQALNFVQEASDAPPVILGGFVAEEPTGRRLIIQAKEIIRPGPAGPEETRAISGLVRLGLGAPLAEVAVGDYIRTPVVLRRLRGFRNPGLPDSERRWAARGVWVSGFVSSPFLVSSWPGEAGPLSGLRRAGWNLIRRNVEDPAAAGLLAAQVLGARGATDEKSEEIFRRLGLSHLLSVSGLHLGLWFGFCFWLIRRALRNFRSLTERGAAGSLAAGLALIPALGYAALAGEASPALRSAAMILAAMLAVAARRRPDAWNILAAAAWFILLIEPGRLWTASFQMSFTATAAMLAVFLPRPGAEAPAPAAAALRNRPVGPLLSRLLKGRRLEAETAGRGDFQTPAFIQGTAKAALAGTLGAAPLAVRHFGFLTLAGLPANLIFTPAISMSVLLPGLSALAVLPFSSSLADGLMSLAGAVMTGLLPLMERLAGQAGPGLLPPAPGPVFITGWYAAGWLFCRGSGRRRVRAWRAGAVLLAALLPGLTDGGAGRLKFTVLDVGQGSAVHISLPDGRQMLVDGGGGRDFDPGEVVIRPYLQRQGLSRLDIAALTHPDQDHLKGLVSAAEYFKPREIWSAPWPAGLSPLYRRLVELAPPARRPDWPELRRPRDFGPARLELLWPLKWPEGGGRTNDLSLVWRLSWGEASFLIAGDIGPGTEKNLARHYGAALKSTVLLAPHHGSRASLTPEFLAAVQPRWTVFSCGRHNAFGFPRPEPLARARAAGAEIWRTDLDGAAVFEAYEIEGVGPMAELKSRPAPDY